MDPSANASDRARGPLSAALLLAAGLLAALPSGHAAAQPVPLPEAPACTQPARPTPRQTEGPYYKPNAPRRHQLVSAGEPGERIILTGFVLSRSCRPVPGAVVDIWQTDASGAYDNAGFDLRGYEVTDAQGRYWFETVLPASYPGRTPHVHVKIRSPGQPELTTQLYVPGERRNRQDRIFNPALLMQVERAAGTRSEEALPLGRYDFVLDMP